MIEALLGDLDEWRPFCGAVYPPERTAGAPMICTIAPHACNRKHLNEDTGFSWWEGQEPSDRKK